MTTPTHLEILEGVEANRTAIVENTRRLGALESDVCQIKEGMKDVVIIKDGMSEFRGMSKLGKWLIAFFAMIGAVAIAFVEIAKHLR